VRSFDKYSLVFDSTAAVGSGELDGCDWSDRSDCSDWAEFSGCGLSIVKIRVIFETTVNLPTYSIYLMVKYGKLMVFSYFHAEIF
jgi:hypothetical protein